MMMIKISLMMVEVMMILVNDDGLDTIPYDTIRYHAIPQFCVIIQYSLLLMTMMMMWGL